MKRRGSALIEVIIAMTILATAGVSISTMVARAAHHISLASRAEDEIVAAGRFMHAVVLWPREDLDRRVGVRRQGEWFLRIDRTGETLYEVELMAADSAILLRTTIYRRR